ncbi:hypothetical protein AUP00_01295 [Neisseria gonorrhoeae]|nr:hypothetical protein AUP00_01295 [Neisseria gonorrhoeae]
MNCLSIECLDSRLRGNDDSYSGLTKSGQSGEASDSTNGTEPVRPVLGRLREPFPLSRGGATPYRFLLIRYNMHR